MEGCGGSEMEIKEGVGMQARLNTTAIVRPKRPVMYGSGHGKTRLPSSKDADRNFCRER